MKYRVRWFDEKRNVIDDFETDLFYAYPNERVKYVKISFVGDQGMIEVFTDFKERIVK
jgi:hypothetical protein